MRRWRAGLAEPQGSCCNGARPTDATLTVVSSPRILYGQVTREDDKKYLQQVVLDGTLVIGRGDPRDDGRHYIQLWREGDDSRISREQCQLDAGRFCVLVTDLGSSNGTRYTPGFNGRIIKMDSLPPGGALYLGNYVLTYKLGSPKGAKRMSFFGRKK